MAGSNPTINYNVLQNYYGPEKGLNLYESNHSFAVSVIGKNDNMPKYDPSYVRMIAQYFAYDEKTEKYVYTEIPLIQCS